MYDKVPTDLKFVEREKEVEKFWEDEHIFEKSIKMREGCQPYVFYDGPPTANGKPHIGHVETRVIKDMIPRFRAMKGYMVPRKAGWDTHGLPVELEVEKKLGLDGKDQIEKYGLEPFIKQCKESVWKYKGMWEDFSGTVGFWADMDNPYVTYHNSFIESEWWALKQIWDKGLLYKGFKVVPYCPRCGTPLSSHEVAQGYKDVKERSAVVRFKVKGEDAYILAWTTTPWTLPSNLALCVNPNEEYVKVKAADGYTYYIAHALMEKVLGEGCEVLETYVGKDLEFKEYEPLYDCSVPYCEKQHKKAFYVVCDTYVTLTDGTGIVHIAPAFGEDDANVGRKNNLPFVHWASFRLLPVLLEAGVRVWFQPPPFAHTKLLAVDGYYCQIGSANLDARSMRLNFELNMEIFDPEFHTAMALHMDMTIARSREVTLKDLQERLLILKLRDAACWLFSPYL